MAKSYKLSIKDNFSFLNRLHNDCSPLQEIRELTVNSIQSIMRTESQTGEILWEVDWQFTGTNKIGRVGKRAKRLCIVDNGDGIKANDMEEFLNQLSAGIQPRGADGDTNYGIGAKIAALPLNQTGLMYQSWVSGVKNGNCIRLGVDSSSSYGLLPMRDAYELRIPIDSAPDLIQNSGHGTKVTLFGNDIRADTMEPSVIVRAMGGQKWLSMYLNSKIFSLPEGIRIRTREWSDTDLPREYGGSGTSANRLRLISGMQKFLEAHKESSGSVRLKNAKLYDSDVSVPATAYWWILKKSEKVTNAAPYIKTSGHVACLFDNNDITEIYEPKYGHHALKRFGVVDQIRRVFIYVKPDAVPGLTTSSGRDALKIGKSRMPWDDWEQEFAENLPEEIADLYEADSHANDSIKDKLRHLVELLSIPRFIRTVKEKIIQGEINVPVEDKGAIEPWEEGDGNGLPPIPGDGNGDGDTVAWETIIGDIAVDDEEEEEVEAPDDIPRIVWVSETPDEKLNIKPAIFEEDGSWTLRDRAAEYIPGSRLLYINFDFRGFQHFLKIMIGNEKRRDKIDVIQRTVMDSTELSLIEAVLGVIRVGGSKGTWPRDDYNKALSPEALTAASMQHYYAEKVLNRSLSHKIGKKK